MNFDRRLLALANCPVLPDDEGSMLFNPYPIIMAPDNEILTHEVCHVMAGQWAYDIFDTAIHARNKDETFATILNVLYDWYHEVQHGKRSGFMIKSIERLHKKYIEELKIKKVDYEKYPSLKALQDLYCENKIPKDMPEVKSETDLVIYADLLREKIPEEIKRKLPLIKKMGGKKKSRLSADNFVKDALKGASGRDIGRPPKRSSSYYQKAVSKYYPIIEELSNLWKKNKYDWFKFYYGEIDWKDLRGMFLGSKLTLPVFRLFAKITLDRPIYLVIDRSSSTDSIKEVLMDTAIIITESLRMHGTPISILDVGPQCKMINDIGEDLDLSWFVPMSMNGTPLGEVCSEIKNADLNSYLLIITDGQPDNEILLKQVLGAFPGEHLTFVIGHSYFQSYYILTGGRAMLVEPNTIFKELMHEGSLS